MNEPRFDENNRLVDKDGNPTDGGLGAHVIGAVQIDQALTIMAKFTVVGILSFGANVPDNDAKQAYLSFCLALFVRELIRHAPDPELAALSVGMAADSELERGDETPSA